MYSIVISEPSFLFKLSWYILLGILGIILAIGPNTINSAFDDEMKSRKNMYKENVLIYSRYIVEYIFMFLLYRMLLYREKVSVSL